MADGCERCDFDGYVDIVDEETGGVLGPAPCPNPECPSNQPGGKSNGNQAFAGRVE